MKKKTATYSYFVLLQIHINVCVLCLLSCKISSSIELLHIFKNWKKTPLLYFTSLAKFLLILILSMSLAHFLNLSTFNSNAVLCLSRMFQLLSNEMENYFFENNATTIFFSLVFVSVYRICMPNNCVIASIWSLWVCVCVRVSVYVCFCAIGFVIAFKLNGYSWIRSCQIVDTFSLTDR